MKKMFLISAIAVFASCGNDSEYSKSSESATTTDTTNSISAPPTSDTTNSVAPMMGDTSKTDADSLKK